ncbi:hypothetical protein HMPREF1486_05620 [Streptomyces sp. HPH0547]|nr:hypothetical protein [Streptomyces albus]EPD90740.1 hypothetical protein HMPREF1486_05620 [Streptomyces sp. HPH0547]GHJ22654.1 hypothetical protein TPA0909_42680 [Streptomyces albus]
MTTAGRTQSAGDRVRDAERARDDLRDTLRAVGVQLPSLGLDAASCVGPAPVPLIDLGRCNVATARALTAALRSYKGVQQGAAR